MVVREVCKLAPEKWGLGNPVRNVKSGLSNFDVNILFGQPMRECVYCHQEHIILSVGSQEFPLVNFREVRV